MHSYINKNGTLIPLNEVPIEEIRGRSICDIKFDAVGRLIIEFDPLTEEISDTKCDECKKELKPNEAKICKICLSKMVEQFGKIVFFN